jgi:hypothetical protein
MSTARSKDRPCDGLRQQFTPYPDGAPPWLLLRRFCQPPYRVSDPTTSPPTPARGHVTPESATGQGEFALPLRGGAMRNFRLGSNHQHMLLLARSAGSRLPLPIQAAVEELVFCAWFSDQEREALTVESNQRRNI